MDATGHDTPRPVATHRDLDFTLSIEEVSERYAKAGHARTIRTLQRYCVSGHLDAQKVATTLGDKYLVTPQSVARHIEQIRELSALDNVATSRDEPRSVATPVADQPSESTEGKPSAAQGDEPRQAATNDNGASRYVELLETDRQMLPLSLYKNMHLIIYKKKHTKKEMRFEKGRGDRNLIFYRDVAQ
jgi:hypothetical protein